jgi:hypothetical protein
MIYNLILHRVFMLLRSKGPSFILKFLAEIALLNPVPVANPLPSCARLRRVQALVLSPTRELAAQTEKNILALGEFLKVQAHCCIGGKSLGAPRQWRTVGYIIRICAGPRKMAPEGPRLAQAPRSRKARRASGIDICPCKCAARTG